MILNRLSMRQKGEPTLIVGLGNPGARYTGSRHNAGFEALVILSQRMDIPIKKKKFNALIGEGPGHFVVLAMPQTFMNLSGQAVAQLAGWYKLPPEKILVIYDDIDLPFGAIRIRQSGGPGTHNGMRSIVEALGREDFPRVRLGIGKPEVNWDLADYVLAQFPLAQRQQAKQLFDQGAQAAEMILQKGIAAAMAQFNSGEKRG